MNQLVLIFIGLSIVNVIISTLKSILTIKGNKWVASFSNAFYYGFYNIVLVYTVMDFPMWEKCLITFACNVVGVFIVKYGEEKARKDKLWKVEMTIKPEQKEKMEKALNDLEIGFNWINIEKYYIFNVYCETAEQSKLVKGIANECGAKYFVSETKNL